MFYLVRKNLFIGNINDAAEILEKGNVIITHILSILSSASISFFSEWRKNLSIPTEDTRKVHVGNAGIENDFDDIAKSALSPGKLLYLIERAGKDLKFVRMGVPIRDMEGENLLDYLDVCFDFIDEKRKEGSVLVHCFAGVSRSAAIVTAYLMRSEKLSQEDALLSLKQSCEFVCPNDGFLEQLQMFEAMGFKVDRSSPVYKRFRLKVLGESYNRGERIDNSQLGADPGLPIEEKASFKAGTGERDTVSTPLYRCNKCRRLVASQDNVISHVPGEGETPFEWYKRRSSNPFNKSDTECSSVFVEPLRWMAIVEEGGIEGKLSCAHCDARLGYFNWSGVQCSCGSWITPACLLKARVATPRF